MSKTSPTRQQLLSGMDQEMSDLLALVHAVGPERLTTATDQRGWTSQDHLDHLAAWERSMVFLFQGRPRHEGLGVSEESYLSHDYDTINAAIRENLSGRTLEATLDDLAATHAQLRAQVEAMSDDHLLRPYHHFLPDEPGERTVDPIAFRVQGNTGDHFREHAGYIRRIVGA